MKKLCCLIVWLTITTFAYSQYESCCNFESNYATCNTINIIGECAQCPTIPESIYIEWKDEEDHIKHHTWKTNARLVAVDYLIKDLKPKGVYQIKIKVKMKGWLLWTEIANFEVGTDCTSPPPNDHWTASGDRAKGWVIGDFNGDGKEDLLRHQNNLGGAEVLISDGSQFKNPAVWTTERNHQKGWYAGDFNGDGKSDILRYAEKDIGGAEVLLSSGTDFQAPKSWTKVGDKDKGWRVGDFNGDGKSDLLRYVDDKGGAEVMLSTGMQFQEPIAWSTATDKKRGWLIGDFNGDEKDDLLRYSKLSGGAEVCLSTGEAFS